VDPYHRRKTLRSCFILAGLVLAAMLLPAAPAAAQALDEARLVANGPDAVLQIRFNVRVQYQRHAPLESSDLIEIYFQLLGGDENLTRQIEESLTVDANPPAPGASIVYPVQNGLPVKKIVIRLSRKVDFRVRAGASNQMLEIILPGLAPQGAAQRVVSPVVEKDRYAISLQTLPMSQQGDVRAIPARLQNYDVFGSQVMRNGTPLYELLLGYFDSQQAAEAVLATIQQEFPGAQVIDVAARKEANLMSAAQTVPPPAPPPPVVEPAAAGAAAAAAEAVAVAPDTELDKQGAVLMAKARSALIAGRNDEAINTLNQLLLLPPNKQSQDAQELVGVARERSGDLAQARKEYELYLRLFPSGEGATRVRQRLASMAPPEVAKTEAAKPPEKKEPQISAGGSIAQSYYGGDQRTQTTQVLVASATVTAATPQLTSNVQSSLTTTVDLNGRYRTENTDTRIVFRDNDQYSFIGAPTSPSLNRLDAAYLDYRDLQHGLAVKVGQQSGVTGGLVGRFLGAVVSYDLAPKLRVNAVAGVPVKQDEFVQVPSQHFEGLSVEAQNFAEHWGGSAFLINQSADGVVDRRAIGADVRYFDAHRTLYALVDYDIEFRALNAATLQGTYTLADQTAMSLLLDDRKAPTLTTTNGLLQSGCSSFVDYFAGRCGGTGPFNIDTLRRAAEATTANSHQLGFDISHPLSKKWQVSFDARISSVGALPAVNVGGIPFLGTAATGNVLSFSAQATGTNLYSARDINVFSTTRLHSETVNGTQFSLNNVNGLRDNRLTLSPSLSYYLENDATGQKISRVSPGFHTGYKLTPRMSLDATIFLERSRNSGPVQNDTTSNVFYYLGYRYDLNY